MFRARKMIVAFVIVIFRPLISAILNFFGRFFKKKFKIFRKIRFPVEHKKNYENMSMGFLVTLLLSTKLQVIYFLGRGIFLSQNKHFLKNVFCWHLCQEKNCGVEVATTRTFSYTGIYYTLSAQTQGCSGSVSSNIWASYRDLPFVSSRQCIELKSMKVRLLVG